MPTPRRMWHLLETIHAVVYFAPEVRDACKALGLKGFWMGYFAGRAAPLGPASPELVTATFFNFHPAMVARALPDAWAIASPAEVWDTRLGAVDEALTRLAGREVLTGAGVAEAADLAAEAINGCSLAGRPLFAATASLAWPDVPHLRLWHAATLVREHRGDGHVAATLANGLDGLGAHVTMSATGAVARSAIQPNRGWSDEEWEQAERTLTDAGILAGGGALTDRGRALRQRIEDTTDDLAAEPWTRLGTEGTARLEQVVAPIADAVRAAGLLPFPNPIGLPATGR